MPPRARPPEPPAQGEPPAFETSLARLEAIVQELESGELDLEASLARFEEGVTLSRRCASQLAQARQRIDVLVRENGELLERPFEPEPGGRRLMDVEAYLAEQAARVDRFLEAHVPPAHEPPARLHGAMRHMLFPGGKRFRPALALAAAQAVGGDPERALPVAAAVELVHTYSLVHDDLPCMDDDATRRGRPTVHVVYGEATAVLAGDALLAEAFRVLLGADQLAPAARLEAARELARAASSRALVGGQAEDLAAAGGPIEPAAVEGIHARKTAALIRAAVVAGARVAGGDPATLERLGRFALSMGVAFQIADDLLDHADGRAPEACSLVSVLGSERARARAETLLASALAEIDGLGEPAEPLRELARMAARRTH